MRNFLMNHQKETHPAKDIKHGVKRKGQEGQNKEKQQNHGWQRSGEIHQHAIMHKPQAEQADRHNDQGNAQGKKQSKHNPQAHMQQKKIQGKEPLFQKKAHPQTTRRSHPDAIHIGKKHRIQGNRCQSKSTEKKEQNRHG